MEHSTDHEAESGVQPSYHLPFLQNRGFIGRGAQLEALRQKLLVTKDCRKAAIVGLGGIGKTQVALEFAYMARRSCPDMSIFWISALSVESFEQDFVEIARQLHIIPAAGDQEDVKKLVQHHLNAETAGRWLLIVDNADDMDSLSGSGSDGWNGLVKNLPDREDGLILFTTRHVEVARALAGSDVIELQEMTQDEAFTFLEKSLIRSNILHDMTTTTKLLQELTYFPLAIAQAAAYLNMNKGSIAQYLKLLRNTEQDVVNLMSQEFQNHTRYRGAKNAAAATWLVSFDQIQKIDPTAANLLSFISCVEHKAIPRSILPSVQPEERMVHAIDTLCGYAFVVRRGEKELFDMHRLLHLAIRVWVRTKKSTTEIADRATRHVANIFPSDDYANQGRWREYLPHALRLLESTKRAKSISRYNLCVKVGMCLNADGRPRDALRLLEDACRWAQDNLDEEDSSRLSSMHHLAIAYNGDGQIKKAIELLEHVVAVQRKALSKEHPNQLTSQHELASAYYADGQISKAVELLEDVVAIRAKTLTEEHPDRLSSQQELANAYCANGQVSEAVELLEHVAIVKQRPLRDDHPSPPISERRHAAFHAALKDER